jgi:uracil-DNA glycosylase
LRRHCPDDEKKGGSAVQEYDPGYVSEPFASLVQQYPGVEVYPQDDFRTEWGPIFHRGRLDGTSRVLVIGQDPAQHETVLRRILVGEAGTRLQGFLAKLGIDKSYTLVNTFLYGVYGQTGGNKHKNDSAIAAYRNKWIDAVVSTQRLDAIVALGQLATEAYQEWKGTPSGTKSKLPFASITHPTRPESASKGNKAKHAEEMQKMLENWNAGLKLLAPAIQHPDTPRALVLYGTDLAPGDKVPIPARDLPAGTPPWMFAKDGWAVRTGATPAEKRATISVAVPKAYLPKE